MATMRAHAISRRNGRPAEAPCDLRGAGLAFVMCMVIGAVGWAAIVAAAAKILQA